MTSHPNTKGQDAHDGDICSTERQAMIGHAFYLQRSSHDDQKVRSRHVSSECKELGRKVFAEENNVWFDDTLQKDMSDVQRNVYLAVTTILAESLLTTRA